MGFVTQERSVSSTPHYDTYADLPAAADNQGKTVFVDTSTGAWYTGDKKNAGAYTSDGTNWQFIGTEISQVSEQEIQGANGVQEVRRFSPKNIYTLVKQYITDHTIKHSDIEDNLSNVKFMTLSNWKAGIRNWVFTDWFDAPTESDIPKEETTKPLILTKETLKKAVEHYGPKASEGGMRYEFSDTTSIVTQDNTQYFLDMPDNSSRLNVHGFTRVRVTDASNGFGENPVTVRLNDTIPDADTGYRHYEQDGASAFIVGAGNVNRITAEYFKVHTQEGSGVYSGIGLDNRHGIWFREGRNDWYFDDYAGDLINLTDDFGITALEGSFDLEKRGGALYIRLGGQEAVVVHGDAGLPKHIRGNIQFVNLKFQIDYVEEEYTPSTAPISVLDAVLEVNGDDVLFFKQREDWYYYNYRTATGGKV